MPLPVDHQSITATIRGAKSQLQYWPRTLRLVRKAAPGWTIAWAILLVIQGLLPAALVYLMKVMVDALVGAKNSGGAWPQVRHALVLVALTAASYLVIELLQGMIEWIRTAQAELVQDYIKSLVHQQSFQVDIAFYESADFHDRLDQVQSEAGNRPLTLLESCGSLVQNSITLLAMAALLFSYGVWLPLILLLSTIPAFYVVLRFDRVYHRWWQRATVNRRWAVYYDAMLTHSASAAEIRLFGLGPHFLASYQKVRSLLRNERLKHMRKQSLAKLGASALALTISGLVLAWMATRALRGMATLGDLALFYQAFSRGQTLMRSTLGSLGQIVTNGLYLGNLFKFLDLKPLVVDPSQPASVPSQVAKGIDFRRLSFSYPGTERSALQDFDLSIPAGKIVALVGVNGAGKSTVVKLLCRFYDPQSGGIEIDGIDIRNFSMRDLRRIVTVLFQFPMQYHATARENIALSDIAEEVNMDEIELAAKRAGAHKAISRLPEGYDTLLGKWFVNGAELSGGEWQRVALARAYFRRSQIIILDEPTSFMDSWGEADWFDRFRAMTAGKTGIVITHRFTIAMRADIIHVINEGRIVESGTHHELLARDGLYAESWKSQMQASVDADLNEPALTFQ